MAKSDYMKKDKLTADRVSHLRDEDLLYLCCSPEGIADLIAEQASEQWNRRAFMPKKALTGGSDSNVEFGIDEAEAAEKAEYEKVQKAADEWKKKWPMHCTACEGWGGKAYRGSYDEPPGFDHCSCTEIGKCPRCGEADAINEDGEGPCKTCGWDYDDGAPQWW